MVTCGDDIGADGQIAGIDGDRSAACHLTHQSSLRIGDTDRGFAISVDVHEGADLHDRQSPEAVAPDRQHRARRAAALVSVRRPVADPRIAAVLHVTLVRTNLDRLLLSLEIRGEFSYEKFGHFEHVNLGLHPGGGFAPQ